MLDLSINPPDPKKIPTKEDILSPTVLMITVFYRRQEFFRCSYFVYNNYEDGNQVLEREEFVYVDKVCRTIICEQPRIRVYEILWDLEGFGGRKKRILKRKKKGGRKKKKGK